MDASLTEVGNEVLARVLNRLVDGLLVEDDTGNALLDLRSGEKKLTVSLSVFFCVLNVNSLEALSNSTSGLVSSKDTLAGGGDVSCDLDKFCLEGLFGVNHCHCECKC